MKIEFVKAKSVLVGGAALAVLVVITFAAIAETSDDTSNGVTGRMLRADGQQMMTSGQTMTMRGRTMTSGGQTMQSNGRGWSTPVAR